MTSMVIDMGALSASRQRLSELSRTPPILGYGTRAGIVGSGWGRGP